ncbi:MAG: hypothetical protein M3O50_22145 [Myxococcota bacterium]|nr:hypothetical protein [Myxococcota bacterium]
MRLRRLCQLLAATMAMAVPRAAWSELPPRALSLVYSAPEGCPSAHDFEQRVRSRSTGNVVRDAPGVTLRVQIAVVNGRHVGRLSVMESDGRSTTKALNGADCEELVNALSLVVALAIDSDEKTKPNSERPPSSTSPSASSSPSSASSAPSPPSPSSPVPPIGRPEQERSRGIAASSRLGLGLGGLVAVGPAPSPLFGGTLDLEWDPFGARKFAPAFEIELAVAESSNEVRTGGTASFTWLNVRADACLLRVPLGPALRLRGCVLGASGVLRAGGSNTVHPVTSSRGWMSIGGVAGLEVGLGARLEFHLLLGVETPLRRDSYAFGVDQFFTVPAATGTASLSLLAYFP